jgi:hypothetical protein
MALKKFTSEVMLNAQVATAEHVRDCDKCRHLFEVAYEEADSEMVPGSSPFLRYDSNYTEIAKMP